MIELRCARIAKPVKQTLKIVEDKAGSLLLRCPRGSGNLHARHQNLSVFSCTDLRLGVPGAKYGAESDFEVRLAVAPQKQ